jgi:hypothetical protein
MVARTGSSAWATARVHDEQAGRRDATATARELRAGTAGGGVTASWSTAADDADKLHVREVTHQGAELRAGREKKQGRVGELRESERRERLGARRGGSREQARQRELHSARTLENRGHG